MRRKLSVLALVAVFLVGVIGTAGFAATEVEVCESMWVDVDTVITDFAEDFAMLGALGIYKGYGDGTARPFHPMTRAEFAVVAIRLMGRERVAKAFELTPPVYPDVPDVWMWGWVNAAHAYGVVAGYPDGTFRPNENINFAEAATMLLRVLDAEPDDDVPWPAGWIAEAIDLEIIDDELDILHVTTVPVLREEMARMAANVLFRATGALSEFEEGEVEAVTATTITVDGDEYDFAAHVSLYGADVLADLEEAGIEFLLNKDGDVAFIRVVEVAPVYETVAAEWVEYDEDEGEIIVEIDDEEVVFDDLLLDDDDELDIDITLNDEAIDVDDIDEGDDVVLTLKDGVVIKITITKDTYEDALLADVEWDEDDEEGTVTVDGIVLDVDEDAVLLLKGEEVTLEALAEAFDDFQDLYDGTPPGIAAVVRTLGNDPAADVLYLSVLLDNLVEGTVTSVGIDATGTFARIEEEDETVVKVYLGDEVGVDVGDEVILLLDSADLARVVLSLDVEVVIADYYAKYVAVEKAKDTVTFSFELSDATLVEFVLDDDDALIDDMDAFELADVIYIETVNGDLDAVSEPTIADRKVIDRVRDTYLRFDDMTMFEFADSIFVLDEDGEFIAVGDLEKGDEIEYALDSDNMIGYMEVYVEPVTTYTLTIAVVGEGMTYPLGKGTHEFQEGETVGTTAVANVEGWEFVGWTGDFVSTDTQMTVTMDADKTVTATFEEEEVEVTLIDNVATDVNEVMNMFIHDVTGDNVSGEEITVTVTVADVSKTETVAAGESFAFDFTFTEAQDSATVVAEDADENTQTVTVGF